MVRSSLEHVEDHYWDFKNVLDFGGQLQSG